MKSDSGIGLVQQRLLQILADGEWHSGEALGQALSISRAAISKQLSTVADLGLDLQRVKGTGYRLVSGLDLLDLGVVEAAPCLAGCEFESIELFQSIESTNAHLIARQRSGQSVHAHVCIAERQTAGRGRRGREWVSPYAQNIYLSFAWHFKQGISALEGLSLAVGVAVCEALSELADVELQLKWPNDILWRERKLGGVLIELGGDAVSDCVAVVGLGLNVRMAGALADKIDQPWVSLSELGCTHTRNELVACILKHLHALFDTYEGKGFAGYREAWNKHNAYAGKHVALHSGGSSTEGEMIGVAANGALILKQGGVIREYIGGELSLRLEA